MRRTKIVCTLGPASDSIEMIKKLVKAGMNVARINLSHGAQEEQLERIDRIKAVREELNVPLAIMVDTRGPEIRLQKFANDQIFLNKDEMFTLTTEDILGDEKIASITYKNLPQFMKVGDKVLIDDGLIGLEVREVHEKTIVCQVMNSGKVSNNKSINLPGKKITNPYMNDKDYNDLCACLKKNIDYIAASFVRNKQDIQVLRDLLDKENASDVKIIAKIENSEGIENIDDIIKEANGVMIARGDMGVEVPYYELPLIQKEIIKKCLYYGKISITATQMLDSMITNPRPTRAEVTDVANAVYDGTSAIMLSGETSIGKWPILTVETMSKIAVNAEDSINYEKRFFSSQYDNNTVTDSISLAACTTAIDLKALSIITVTQSGHTARMISKYRPKCSIIAFTTLKKSYYQMGLVWGVYPFIDEVKNTSDELYVSALEKVKNLGIIKKKGIVVLTGSSTLGVSGTTNTIRVEKI